MTTRRSSTRSTVGRVKITYQLGLCKRAVPWTLERALERDEGPRACRGTCRSGPARPDRQLPLPANEYMAGVCRNFRSKSAGIRQLARVHCRTGISSGEALLELDRRVDRGPRYVVPACNRIDRPACRVSSGEHGGRNALIARNWLAALASGINHDGSALAERPQPFMAANASNVNPWKRSPRARARAPRGRRA